jgi:hypothetical protein
MTISVKRLAVAVVLPTLLGAWGWFGDTKYQVQIDGTPGVPFSGACQVFNSSGSSTRDATGTVPLSFEVSGTIVSCSVQKKSENGNLRLTIKRNDGSIAAQSSTSQAYGVATAAAR